MRVRGSVVVIGLVALVLMTGCSGTGSGSSTPAPTVTVTVTPSAPPTPKNVSAAEIRDGFVLPVKAGWTGSAVPSDDDLTGYGVAVCDKLRSGTAKSDVVVLARTENDYVANNDLIVTYAIKVFCTELG